MADYINFKKSNCRNCYKCIRHCPVKSIKFTGHRANIMSDDCILCGRCFVVCPQNAKEIADNISDVRALLRSGAPVIASVAPSFLAYFEDCGFDALKTALLKLGFTDAEETAIGATHVKLEYERKLSEEKPDVIISSCCHSANLLIEKYYPEALKYLANVLSPMVAHSVDIKKRHPDAKTVFIGPCIAKKDEAQGTAVDIVITFRELSKMFEREGIEIDKQMDSEDRSRARLFPTVGGVIRTMDTTKFPEYTFIAVDGADKCRAAIEDVLAGNVHNCFLELSTCEGSCIAGPIMEKYTSAPIKHFKAIRSYAGKSDFEIEALSAEELKFDHPDKSKLTRTPSEKEIREALRQLGKTSVDDELNCGGCGYETCREKAIAICLGKADTTVCLPYLMDNAERFSANILDNTPNGILVVNESYEVQRVNRAALRMLRIKYESDVLGEPLVSIMDPMPFFDVLENKKIVRGVRDFYPTLDRYLELTIVHDKASHSLIAIIRDVTAEEEERKKKEDIGKQTVDIADKVISKQMRIVQEIASLLGETTAETKIALTKLKDSIAHDEH